MRHLETHLSNVEALAIDDPSHTDSQREVHIVLFSSGVTQVE